MGLTALAIVAAIALSACGGGGAADDAKFAVKSYVNAFVDGDGDTACGLMTRSTRSQFVKRTKPLTKTSDCTAAIEAIRTQAGQTALDALRKVKYSDVKVDGSTARVKLTSGKSSTTASLKKESGGWKVSGAPGTGTQ